MQQNSLLRGDVPPATPRTGIQSLRSSLGCSAADLLGGGSPARGNNLLDSAKLPAAAAAQPPRFDNILTSLEFSLNAPTLHQRCAEVSTLLADCPAKDLPALFRTLVDRIFGLSTGGRGWGLNAIQKTSQYKDFLALTDFLSPRGPLLRACYRLLADPFLRYDFPVSLLSAPTRQQLEAGGSVSPFLAPKLAAAHHSPAAAALQLNAFEFYMFTFAAYIVQPYTPDNKFIPGESLYPNVVEDYLAYFLPCDGTTPPSLPFPLAVAAATTAEAARPPVAVTPTRKSLLKQSAILATPPVRSPPTAATTVVSSPSGQEIWRSETLINTFGEFWLTTFSPPAVSRGRHGSPSLDAATADLTFATSDVLRIVREVIALPFLVLPLHVKFNSQLW
jgi:hypothetical protein